MRDFIFTHAKLTIVFVFIWYGGMIALSFYHALAAFILGAISSFVLAHLIWGSKYIEGEQEDPQYLGG